MPISLRLPEKLSRAEQVSSVLQKSLHGFTYLHLPPNHHITNRDQSRLVTNQKKMSIKCMLVSASLQHIPLVAHLIYYATECKYNADAADYRVLIDY